ncbi:MAG: CRTAC1 family protein [Bacteroidota bacterium]
MSLIIGVLEVSAQNDDQELVIKPGIVSVGKPVDMELQISEAGWYQMNISASTVSRYAQLSISTIDKKLVDNLPLPKPGPFESSMAVYFKKIGNQKLIFESRDGDINIEEIALIHNPQLRIPIFRDISVEKGLISESTWKYGGPTVADINNDGYYDFILNNHDKVPTQLFWNEQGMSLREHNSPLRKWDVHGTAAGDYDQDGDLDIVISQGGGNGTNPQPPHVLRNDGGVFSRVSDEIGVDVGSRGRSVRWSDMDLDGDLDLLIINAAGIDPSGGAQHIFYKNLGNGQFERVEMPGLEDVNVERCLITDINNDQIDDLILFSPISIWEGTGDFSFKDVTSQRLDEGLKDLDEITAVAPIDLENDGDTDLYLSRGKPYYFIANKSLDFDPSIGRIDIRDEGNKAITSMEIDAEDTITISNVFLWYRLYDNGFPLHLGEAKRRYVLDEEDSLKISPDMAGGWPDDRSDNGWYFGYLGDGKWKVEWVRNSPIYWGIRISIDGVSAVRPDFEPQNRNVQDVVLRNDGVQFTDVSKSWNIPQGGNHQGVTVGDFNNDGLMDLYVYRFGYLRSPVADWLLINDGSRFSLTTAHTATDPFDLGHGDMGQAFDWDNDGDIDLLNGRDNPGKWYLYDNNTTGLGNYVIIRVGNSPDSQIDPQSSIIQVKHSGRTVVRRVESSGAVHSQSLLNIVHVGLGRIDQINSIRVCWRDGECVTEEYPKINTLIEVGRNVGND